MIASWNHSNTQGDLLNGHSQNLSTSIPGLSRGSTTLTQAHQQGTAIDTNIAGNRGLKSAPSKSTAEEDMPSEPEPEPVVVVERDGQDEQGEEDVEQPTGKIVEAVTVTVTATANSPTMLSKFNEEFCTPSWVLPYAYTPSEDPNELAMWERLEAPYAGCPPDRATKSCKTVHIKNIIRTCKNCKPPDGWMNIPCGVPPDDPDSVDFPQCTSGETPQNKIFIPMHTPQSWSFQHFIDNGFTRLVRVLDMLKEEGDTTPIRLVLAPGSVDQIVRDILAKLGIEISTNGRDSGCYKRVVWLCRQVPFHPANAKLINKYLRAITPGNGADQFLPLKPPFKVYTPRGRARNGRNVANDQAVISALQQNGFVIFDDSWPMDKRMQLFSNTSLLVSSHSGAEYNMMWMPAGGTVFELDGYNKYKVFWWLASATGLNYAWMRFNPSTGFDIPRVLRAFDNIDKHTFAPPYKFDGDCDGLLEVT